MPPRTLGECVCTNEKGCTSFTKLGCDAEARGARMMGSTVRELTGKGKPHRGACRLITITTSCTAHDMREIGKKLEQSTHVEF